MTTPTQTSSPHRTAQLRVKVKTLAAEARFIRREERAALRRGRYWRYRDDPDDPMKSGRTLTRAYADYEDLHTHRTGLVRSVARTNLLAYAALRGVPYATAEVRCRTAPKFDEVGKIARRFGLPDADWKAWLEAARQHLQDQKHAQAAAAA